MSPPSRIHVEIKWHTDVQMMEDEWNGTTDPSIRRKLQNRLNQRAHRRRKHAEKKGKYDRSLPPKLQDGSAGLNDTGNPPPPSVAAEPQNHFPGVLVPVTGDCGELLPLPQQPDCRISQLQPLEEDPRPSVWHQDQSSGQVATFSRPGIVFPLPADHLLSLIYYNVLRAFVSNLTILGFDRLTVCDDESISPFYGSTLHDTTLALLPIGLRPTQLQCETIHHPMWDMFPDPTLRNNIFTIGEENIDDIEICLDLVGQLTCIPTSQSSSEAGVIVWSDPWDISSWEVTERFAAKWSFILHGATNLLASTNKWREARGEPPISFG